jgi:hypothetical protein
MRWMNGRMRFWGRFGGIAFVIVILFSMSSCGVPALTNILVPTATPMPATTVVSLSTETLTPTSTPEMAEIPTQTYPEPTLLSPASGATITVGELTKFCWRWDGVLQENEKFDLRIWQSEESPSTFAMSRECNILLDAPLGECGHYLWQVAVVRIDKDGNKSILSESQILPFVWSEVTPTPTPTKTATAMPSPTFTSTPTPEAVVVWEGGLNLRSGPGIIYARLGSLHNGDLLDVQGRVTSNEWILVVPIGSTNVVSGWVSALPQYVQINIDLGGIPVVKVPPTPTATPSPPPPIPVITAPPTLFEPLDKAGSYRNRLDLSWDWPGTLGPNDYFQVEIRNRYNAFSPVIDEFVPPIDVAWVKNKFYRYDMIEEAYDREYTWRITVVRGMPAGEKQWSTPENRVWEPGSECPGTQCEVISDPSEMRTLYVEPGDEPPPPTGEPGPAH